MRRSVVLVLLGIAIAANGCGGSSSGGKGGAGGGGAGVGGNGGGSAGTGGGGTGGTGGTPACGAATGPDIGATCNVIAAGSGPCVISTFSTEAPPAPAGGAIAGGTYNLASDIFHGSAADEANFLPGQPFRLAYVLSDVTASSFTLDQVWTTGTIVARMHATAAVSGMTATFTQTCPAPDAGSNFSGNGTFTATSSALTLIRSVTNGITEVTVFNKAP